MALNIKMHKRNPYNEKIDFEYFASKYDLFRNVVTKSKSGKIFLNFKNPKCQHALSWCILKEDFDIDVIIPVNKLIPTIPLRLNYILWIEDIFNFPNLYGIDIGCGSSCIYSLLGAKKNQWHFLSTESDRENYNIAVENVNKNKLNDFIKVVKVDNESSLTEILEKFYNSDYKFNNSQTSDLENVNKFNFVMCNPPFFDSINEYDLKVEKRRNNFSTADVLERSYFDRGEVGFVQKIIIDASLKLKHQVRVYSTMLGKKESLKLLIKILKENKIENIGKTEFCQGNTMRWGLAWSFDKTLKFPPNLSKTNLTFSLNIDRNINHNWNHVVEKIDEILLELDADITKISEAAIGKRIYEMEFKKNTWSNQRNKRRMTKMKFGASDHICDIQSLKKFKNKSDNKLLASSCIDNKAGLPIDYYENIDTLVDLKNGNTINKEVGNTINNIIELNSNVDESCNINNDSFVNILLKCKLIIIETSDSIELKLKLIEAISKDHLHCLFQLFKNRFSK